MKLPPASWGVSKRNSPKPTRLRSSSFGGSPRHSSLQPRWNGIYASLRQACRVFWRRRIKVFYEDEIVGEYFADILVDDKVIVEIKAVKNLAIEHEAQLLNYLKATDKEVGLLLNFGPKPKIKRRVFDNFRK